MRHPLLTLCAFALATGLPCLAQPRTIPMGEAAATEPVAIDADDPAIWVNAADPSRSLIIGTDKGEGQGEDPGEGLYVFDLSGKRIQAVGGVDGPNNVAVEYGFDLDGRPVDLVVAVERRERRLRAFLVDPNTLQLTDASSPDGLGVFAGEEGGAGAPMGVDLYRRPSDGAVFAVVSRKEGPTSGYVWQYRLESDGAGRVKATKVRELGNCTVGGEIEALVVDDELGFVYVAEEGRAITKWHADPDHPDAGVELAVFAQDGYEGDREGLAILRTGPGVGYLLSTDQIEGGSEIHVYRREGAHGDPHDHSELVAVVGSGADDTDGMDAVSAPLGPEHPKGIIVVMNSADRNFLILDAAEFLKWIGE